MRLAMLILTLPAVAAAEPISLTSTADAPTYEVGIRVGGYGFRRDGDPRPGEGWTECRMNGFGVFGGRALTGPLFLEAGLDLYSTATGPIGPASTDLPIDRTSGLVSSAIGVRTQVTSWLRGYVQLGAGVELTRVSVPYGDMRIRDSKLLPEGFFGAGLDLRIAKGTYIGSSVRALVMGNFDYDANKLDTSMGWTSPPPASEVFAASAGVAAQAQFYVRHDL